MNNSNNNLYKNLITITFSHVDVVYSGNTQYGVNRTVKLHFICRKN